MYLIKFKLLKYSWPYYGITSQLLLWHVSGQTLFYRKFYDKGTGQAQLTKQIPSPNLVAFCRMNILVPVSQQLFVQGVPSFVNLQCGVIQVVTAIFYTFVTCSNVPAISSHNILINVQYNFQHLNDKHFSQMVLSTSN